MKRMVNNGGGADSDKKYYNVTKNYEKELEKILDKHELMNPIPNIKKYEIIKGDATIELEKYLDKHPETIISMAWFDMDLYKPTKECLEKIKPHLTKGSILYFDELNLEAFPGETVALKEVFGLKNIKIKRTPFSIMEAYVEIE